MTRISTAQLFGDAMRARQAEMHTAMPAEVVSYDQATQTASVQPLLQYVLRDETGAELVESYPQIDAVPVQFPRYGGFVMTMPVAAGDIVLLVCAERSLDRWRASGGQVDPGDLRMHSLADAVAIPGIYPTSEAIPSASVSTTGAYLGKEGGPGVHVTAAGVELGGSVAAPPTDFVALSALVTTAFTTLKTALAAAPASVVSGDGGAAIFTALNAALAAWPATVAATKVKAV